jgi:hypothetical protein
MMFPGQHWLALNSPSTAARRRLQGAITQFMKFGAGIVVAAVALKSLDRLLYSLDET